MDKILNFQVSLFGGFIDIKPRTEIILELLTNLKDDAFIPGTVDLAVLDAVTRKISTDSRIQMMSQDKVWSIVFLEDRIDFNYNYQEKTISLKKVDEFYQNVKGLVEKVFRVFPDTKGNRIAFNGKVLLNEMTDEQILSFMNKFSSPLSIYNETRIEEWAVRFNTLKDIEWKEKIETCNCITEISKIIRMGDVEENRIIISIDVNTIQQKLDYRFQYNDILDFAEKAEIIVNNIINEIESR